VPKSFNNSRRPAPKPDQDSDDLFWSEFGMVPPEGLPPPDHGRLGNAQYLDFWRLLSPEFDELPGGIRSLL